jgi:predicted phage tail protein
MVHIGKSAIDALDEIENPTGSQEEISITPVLQGAGGGGLGQIFAGIALVAAAIFLGPIGAGAGALFTAGSGVATAVGGIGAGLLLTGTAQLLSPALTDQNGTFGTSTPSRTRARSSFLPESNETADNRSSYIFNGPVNLTAQGNPVPLCYGRMIIGSVVISAGLSVEDI